MRKVKRTKKPTMKQMINMAFNLEKKTHRPSNITVKVWGNHVKCASGAFQMYVEDLCCVSFDTWVKCQNAYFTLMEACK